MGSFTVFFDGQFWVGLATRERDGVQELARVLFGPEPSPVELSEWARDEFHRLRFEPVDVELEPAAPLAKNPKRRQREARQELEAPPVGTAAQRALEGLLTTRAVQRKTFTKAQREAEAQRRWELRVARRKKRHRGH